MSDFQTVAKGRDVAVGAIASVDLAGREIAVANIDGAYYAFDNRCTCVTHFAGHVDDESSDGHRHVGPYPSGKLNYYRGNPRFPPGQRDDIFKFALRKLS